MASFLFLIAGVVIGLIGGWLLRGLRAADAKPDTTPKPAAPATAKPKPAADSAKETAPTPAAEPADATQPIAAEEPAADATQPITTVEPAAATQPIIAAAPEPVAEPVTVVADLPTEPVPDAEEPSAAPVSVTVADDLTKIAGIGPKISAALAAAGITTYRQLADTDVATLRSAITSAGLRLAPSLSTWPERAKQLAER